MKRTLIGLGIATLGFVAMKLYRRRKKQQRMLAVLTHSIEDDQIRELAVRVEQHDGDRQVIRFSGLAGTASFSFSVDMCGELHGNYFVRLGEEELNIRPFSITDAGFGFRRVTNQLQQMVMDQGIKIEIVKIS